MKSKELLAKVTRMMRRQCPTATVKWVMRPRRVKCITGLVVTRATVLCSGDGFRTREMMVADMGDGVIVS